MASVRVGEGFPDGRFRVSKRRGILREESFGPVGQGGFGLSVTEAKLLPHLNSSFQKNGPERMLRAGFMLIQGW